MKNIIMYLMLIILLVFAIPLFFTNPKDTIETSAEENVVNNVEIQKDYYGNLNYQHLQFHIF